MSDDVCRHKSTDSSNRNTRQTTLTGKILPEEWEPQSCAEDNSVSEFPGKPKRQKTQQIMDRYMTTRSETISEPS